MKSGKHITFKLIYKKLKNTHHHHHLSSKIIAKPQDIITRTQTILQCLYIFLKIVSDPIYDVQKWLSSTHHLQMSAITFPRTDTAETDPSCSHVQSILYRATDPFYSHIKSSLHSFTYSIDNLTISCIYFT